VDEIERSTKNTVPQPAATRVIEVIDISDSEDVPPSHSYPEASPDPENLYRQLVAHRQSILYDDCSLTKDDVFDDETLEMLSVAPPQGNSKTI
jgi:hypothetical protein